MSGFTLLWSKILHSSIWDEPTPTRVVWFTFLALKDEDGNVTATFESLRRSANVTAEECAAAVATFEAPDPASGSQEEEGRRIKKVAGGWLVVNHEKYRFSSEERRIYWRQKKAEQRAKEAALEPKKRKEKLYGTPKTFDEKRIEKLENPEGEDGPIPP